MQRAARPQAHNGGSENAARSKPRGVPPGVPVIGDAIGRRLMAGEATLGWASVWECSLNLGSRARGRGREAGQSAWTSSARLCCSSAAAGEARMVCGLAGAGGEG